MQKGLSSLIIFYGAKFRKTFHSLNLKKNLQMCRYRTVQRYFIPIPKNIQLCTYFNLNTVDHYS